MGATTFEVVSHGKTAEEAFAKVGGGEGRSYSGDIRAKHDFIEIELPDGEKAEAYAHKILHDEVYLGREIGTKWGPAACLKTGPDTYLFFGWASE